MLDRATARASSSTLCLGAHRNVETQRQPCNVRLRHSRHARLAVAVRAERSLFSLPRLLPWQQQKDTVQVARRELLQLLQESSGDKARISQYVQLLAGSRRPFREQALGGGPWQVVYTEGPLLWQTSTAPGRLLKRDNEFSQSFAPSGRRVVNKGELLGPALYITAQGTYEPQGQTATTPVEIKANIESGTLHVLGAQLPLPIRGTGFVCLAYVDDCIRIFRQRSGSLAVQMRVDQAAPWR